jgi:hypothetical protein
MSERRLGPETRAIIEAIHGTKEAADNYQVGLWTFECIGKTNEYKVYPTVDPNGIAMTAADVVTQLHIPFPHRWEHIHFYHTTAAYVASADALAAILRRTAGTLTPVRFSEDLFNEPALVASRITEVFGEPFKYEATTYNLTLNTTNLHLIFPLFYISKLGS